MKDVWEEFWTFEITAGDIFLALAGGLLAAALWSGLIYAWRWALRYVLRRRNARRRLNFIELWRRVKSDEYFAARQRVELNQLMLVFTLGILAVLSYGFSLIRPVPNTWAIAGLLLIVAEYVVIAMVTLEHSYYKAAARFRIRLERRRKSFVQRRGRRSRRRTSPGASGAESGSARTPRSPRERPSDTRAEERELS
jgi:hypothetical protein